MKHEELFPLAVSLAAAFISNGDIRIGDSTRPGSTAMLKTLDVIASLYEHLVKMDAEISAAIQPPDTEQ